MKKLNCLLLISKVLGKISIYFILLFSYPSIFKFKLLSNVKIKNTEFSIVIIPKFNGEEFELNKKFINRKNSDSLSLTKFRFYITNIEILFNDNSFYKEKYSYHLIDLEVNNSLRLSLNKFPRKEISNIKFCIGVDSSTNVSGALNGDLDPRKGMYWSWNSGYINLKMEGNYSSHLSMINTFEYHIGGYKTPNNTLRYFSFEIPKNYIDNSGINLILVLDKFFDSFDYLKNSSVVFPNLESNIIMDCFKNIFKISNNEN